VLTVASKGLLAKPFLKVKLDDPELKQARFSVEKAYYQSKLAQIMYTFWLADRFKADGVTVNCIRVPAVRVDMAKYANLPKFLLKMYEMKSRSALSPAEMAEVYAWAAVDETLNGITGKYFDENKQPVTAPRFTLDPGNIQAVMDVTYRYIK
jgi:NAD(P)-dependent dehydrogenase (short-subunit alcohol dehydrogenase family)